MKKSKIIAILCVVMLGALALVILTGCNPEGTQHHYDYLVTFNYNVDNLKDPNDPDKKLETASETEYLGVLAGSKLVEPGSISEIVFQKFEIKGYFIEGWYTAELDAEGNPVKDDNGDIVLKDKWNFKTDTVSSDMTLYAKLLKKVQFRIMTGENSFVVIDGQPGRVVEQVEALSVVKRDGWTFTGEIFEDSALTKEMSFPYTLGDEDFECHAKMLEGNWKFVDDTDSFLNALSLGNDIYINVKELDFADVKFRTSQSYAGKDPMAYFGGQFYGKIEGNDCVIKNLTIELSYTRSVSPSTYALFETLGATAQISNLTFQNVNIEVVVNDQTKGAEFKTAFFAVNIEEGAALNNVKFIGCTYTLTNKGFTRVLENLDETLSHNGYYFSGSSFDCFDASQLTVTDNISQ